MRALKNAALFLAVIGVVGVAKTADIVNLNIGDTAPTFQAKDDRGKDFQSHLILGENNLVVYFYPAAMTGGCTAQACAFRDDQAAFADLNTIVVGVSGDSVKNLAYFKQAHNLNFPLIADPDGAIAKAFGVPIKGGAEITRTINEKQVTLARSITESRWTFIIDKEGKIIYKDTNVKASQDSDNVLNFLKSNSTTSKQ